MTTPAQQPRIRRTWAMPNKNTFQIPQIKNLIDRFGWDWVDPFPDPYQQDALEYLSGFKDGSVSYLLFDPPYSPRQLKECYESNGQSLHDTTSAVWRRWKDEIARVTKPNGICISFGWSSNGIGKKRGFDIVEILLIAHGGNHNDTICTVEQKQEQHP
jgi:hypothetical protein